jgi:hypothetical protein
MGDSYPKEVITNTSRRKLKTFSTTPVTPELIDEVYASINDRRKLIKTLTIAKCNSSQYKRPSENACANVYYLG